MCLENLVGRLQGEQAETGHVAPSSTHSRPHAWASHIDRQGFSLAEWTELEEICRQRREQLGELEQCP